MRKRDSRSDLPWPPAPVPAIPRLSADLTRDEIVDVLDQWYGVLDHWLHIWRRRNAVFFRRLPKIEDQIRLLVRYAEEYLTDVNPLYDVEKRSTVATYRELLARCLGCYGSGLKHVEATAEF